MPNKSKPAKPATAKPVKKSPSKPAAKTGGKGFPAAAFANPIAALAVHKVLDPRPAVHQCIRNAGGKPANFNRAAPLNTIGADPASTALCVNGAFAIHIQITGADSENSIVTKVNAALPKVMKASSSVP